MQNKPLFTTGQDWDFELLEKFDEVSDKYMAELGFDYYPLQIEVVSAEQMLDLYCSIALPIDYSHWSKGKAFIRDYDKYMAGKMGLAFEICLNSNPSYCYIMEENDALTQFLVISHVKGHSADFKMNYLYRDNSDADNIVNYMSFARDFIHKCEEKYGVERVEYILDLAHSLSHNGVDKFRRKHKSTIQAEKERQRLREVYEQEIADYTLDKLIKRKSAKSEIIDEDSTVKNKIILPEENIIYFLEKNSPVLKRWEREILRIVRKIAQYFYAQIHGNVLSEGTASFCHYYCLTRAYEDGYITEGSYMQFLHMHSSVINQRDMTPLNPYHFGFYLMHDIKRICENPTEEDYRWFPAIVNTDWKVTLKDVITNYRDDALIRTFMSPTLMRKFKLLSLENDSDEDYYLVTAHCDDSYYRKLRNDLADNYLIGNRMPEIEISRVDENGLTLMYKPVFGRELHKDDAYDVCMNISLLFGDRVNLVDDKEEVIVSVG